MNLIKPTLFRRSDGSSPAQNNTLHDIEQYFVATNNTCVHFGKKDGKYYVINLLKTHTVINSQICQADVCNALSQLYPNGEYIKDSIFFAARGIDYKIVIINDSCNWQTESNNVLVVDFTVDVVSNASTINHVTLTTQKDFQQYLVATYGINRTNKPLKYATTNFEGFLSDVSVVGCQRQDITLFPGDVDLLTYSNNYKLCDVFEFKKHTDYGGNLTLQQQSFENYLDRDRKKYQGLAALASSLGKDYFYNVLYSTRKGEEKLVKIEKVSCALSLFNSTLITFNTRANFIANIKKFTNNNY